MSKSYKGSCLCGQVKFSVESFSEKAANCHCTMCRKFHGAAFGTLVGVTGLQWLSGEDKLKEFTADNGTVRTFCGECGSGLGFKENSDPSTELELAIATFDEDLPVKIDANIYMAYKANWCDFKADIPNYLEGRES